MKDVRSTQPWATLDAWLVAVVALGLLLRLWHLGVGSVWVDEVYRLGMANGHFPEPSFGILAHQAETRLPATSWLHALGIIEQHNPPVFCSMLHAWIGLVGKDSDFWLRLPSALFGTFSIGALYLATYEFSDRNAARWAAFLIAISPMHIFYAQEINHYILAVFLTTLETLLFLRWQRQPNAAMGLSIIVVGLAALLTHYHAGLVLLVQGLWLVARSRPSFAWRTIFEDIWPWAGIAMCFALHLRITAAQVSEIVSFSASKTFGGMGHVMVRLREFIVDLWIGETIVKVHKIVVGSLMLSFGAALVLAIRRLRWLKTATGWSSLLFLGPFLVSAALYLLTKTHAILVPKYQLVFTPGLFLLLAQGLPRKRWGVMLCGTLLCLGAISGLVEQYYGKTKEPWKEMAAYIDGRAGPQDGVIIYRDNLVSALAHYLHHDLRLYGVNAQQLNAIETVAREHPVVWLAIAWSENDQIVAKLRQRLRTYYDEDNTVPLRPDRVGGRLYRFSSRRPIQEFSAVNTDSGAPNQQEEPHLRLAPAAGRHKSNVTGSQRLSA